jgi:AcrR family transcriptional regulator
VEAGQTTTVSPVTSRGEKAVESILNATLNILQAEGYGALTTNHIAAESGIKVGSIYRFFANKEAIVVALMERWHASILATTDDYIASQPPSASFQQVLNGLILVSAEQEYANSTAYKEVWLASSTVPQLKSIAHEHQKRIANRVIRIYKLHSTGQKSKAEIVEFATFLHGLVSAVLSQISELKPKARDKQLRWIGQMIKTAVKTFEST